jgi:hypothetical protein
MPPLTQPSMAVSTNTQPRALPQAYDDLSDLQGLVDIREVQGIGSQDLVNLINYHLHGKIDAWLRLVENERWTHSSSSPSSGPLRLPSLQTDPHNQHFLVLGRHVGSIDPKALEASLSLHYSLARLTSPGGKRTD